MDHMLAHITQCGLTGLISKFQQHCCQQDKRSHRPHKDALPAPHAVQEPTHGRLRTLQYHIDLYVRSFNRGAKEL